VRAKGRDIQAQVDEGGGRDIKNHLPEPRGAIGGRAGCFPVGRDDWRTGGVFFCRASCFSAGADKQAKRCRSSAAAGKPPPALAAVTKRSPLSGGLCFAPPAPAAPVAVEQPKLQKKPSQKNDPALVAAARELRDRWLDEVNAGRYLPAANGKYDVARALTGPTVSDRPALALPRAA